MTTRWFPSLAVFLFTIAAASTAAAQQTGNEEVPARRGFERRYIDADERRSDPVLLMDWPELNRLIRWSHRLETAVVEDDSTLSAELVEEFRARLDTLAGAPLPGFLAAGKDSVKLAIEAIRADLDLAEGALSAPPPTVRATGDTATNAPERQRTLVTGRTAVTVPAGVAVGGADTLPGAELVGSGAPGFVDFVAQALADLDRLVHLTRSAGARAKGKAVSEDRGGRERAPSPDTGPPRRER